MSIRDLKGFVVEHLRYKGKFPDKTYREVVGSEEHYANWFKMKLSALIFDPRPFFEGVL